MTSSSFTPDSNSAFASESTSPTGRDTRSPRRLGMMQKVQRWLQPFADLEVGVVLRRELDADRRAPPAPGRRTGSCGFGTCACTASSTSSVACGPVTASTLGCICRTRLPPPSPAFAPRQPVTTTLPFSASASPIVSRLSLTASSMKPQVLTITRSAPAKVFEVA
jgi:hypothetical protein